MLKCFQLQKLNNKNINNLFNRIIYGIHFFYNIMIYNRYITLLQINYIPFT